MGFTTAYANKILTDLFGNTKYIALTTSAPTAGSTGADLAEPPAEAGYARAKVSGGNFKATNRTITNGDYIYYPEATSSWGTIQYLCIVSTSERGTGTLDYFGQITNTSGEVGVAVGANTVPLFKPNTINISLDAD